MRWLNMRGHVSANVTQVEGPGGANRRGERDGYRPDTLGGGAKFSTISAGKKLQLETQHIPPPEL